MWDECNCAVVWTFFGIAFLWDWNENWPFPVLWPLLSIPNSVPYWVKHFTAASFRIWNSSPGIPSSPLALFVVMYPKAYHGKKLMMCHQGEFVHPKSCLDWRIELFLVLRASLKISSMTIWLYVLHSCILTAKGLIWVNENASSPVAPCYISLDICSMSSAPNPAPSTSTSLLLYYFETNSRCHQIRHCTWKSRDPSSTLFPKYICEGARFPWAGLSGR